MTQIRFDLDSIRNAKNTILSLLSSTIIFDSSFPSLDSMDPHPSLLFPHLLLCTRQLHSTVITLSVLERARLLGIQCSFLTQFDLELHLPHLHVFSMVMDEIHQSLLGLMVEISMCMRLTSCVQPGRSRCNGSYCFRHCHYPAGPKNMLLFGQMKDGVFAPTT